MIRVLVVGTSFGKFYLDAIEKSDKLRLVGILSRGSEKSKKLSLEYGVNNYTDISEIDWDNVDIAVVAVRSLVSFGKGGELARKITEKGVTVLEEQPVFIKEVENILNNVTFGKNAYDVSNFYRYISMTEDFINMSAELRNKSVINCIKASVSIQVLFPLLDILYDIVGGLQDIEFRCVDKGRICILRSIGGDTEIYLDVYNEYEPNNIDGSFQLLYNISIETNKGILTLSDPAGYVFWQNHFIMSDGNNHEILSKTKVSEILHSDSELSFKNLYDELWTDAMQKAILNCYSLAENAELMKQKSEKLLTVCRLWRDISKSVGKPHKIKSPYGNF